VLADTGAMHKLTVLTTLLLATSIASADLAQDTAFDLGRYAGSIAQLETGRVVGDATAIGGCYKVVATAEAAGFHGDMRDEDFERIEGVRVDNGAHFLPFAKAKHNVCDRFAHAYRLAVAAQALAEPHRLVGIVMDASPGTLGSGDALLAVGKKCTADLDAAVAAGADTKAKIPEIELTIPEAKAQICDRITARAQTLDADREAEIRADEDRITKPLKAAGIAGDKLKLLLEHDGYAFYGVGGAELRDPAQLAKARLIFEVTTSYEAVTVRRYVFAGNKLKGMTYENYLAQPGSHAFR
jgi:hypothetical protein